MLALVASFGMFKVLILFSMEDETFIVSKGIEKAILREQQVALDQEIKQLRLYIKILKNIIEKPGFVDIGFDSDSDEEGENNYLTRYQKSIKKLNDLYREARFLRTKLAITSD